METNHTDVKMHSLNQPMEMFRQPNKLHETFMHSQFLNLLELKAKF